MKEIWGEVLGFMAVCTVCFREVRISYDHRPDTVDGVHEAKGDKDAA